MTVRRCHKCKKETSKQDKDGWFICQNEDCEVEEFDYV